MHGGSSGYRETPPPRRLQHVVECGWQHGDLPGDHPVLPDGCVDILLDLSLGRAAVVGAMTVPFVVPAGAGEFVGIRLRPGAAGRVFGAGVHEWTDGMCPLGDVWPDADEWVARVAAAPVEQRARVLLAELEARRPQSIDPRIAAAVEWLRSRRGRIGDLCAELGISRQYLARRFRAEVGVGPKFLARVFRLQALLAGLAPAPGRPWSQVAVAAGYADQAHMIAEFRELTGTTPSRWPDAARHRAVDPVSIPPIPRDPGTQCCPP
ncbi:MAG: AraC family transcriptional regulator [Planctomycetes bacterium]|nr:AraC family transcriptional regulator [Planctomycetota bacterium]